MRASGAQLAATAAGSMTGATVFHHRGVLNRHHRGVPTGLEAAAGAASTTT